MSMSTPLDINFSKGRRYLSGCDTFLGELSSKADDLSSCFGRHLLLVYSSFSAYVSCEKMLIMISLELTLVSFLVTLSLFFDARSNFISLFSAYLFLSIYITTINQ